MRRAAAALATAVLVAVVLTGPMASLGHAEPSPSITCPGAAASPECQLLDQLAAQLAPLQPVLALAGPVTAQLAPALQGLAGRADQPGGVPASLASNQAQALLDQLSVLPAPVRDLLSAPQLGGVLTTLEDLVAELAEPVVGGPSAADASTPTPAATGGSTSGPSGPSSSDMPPLGGSVSASAGAGATPATSSSAMPDVPVGDSLTFAPLALPDFGFSPTVGLESSAPSPELVDEVQHAVNAAAIDLANPSHGVNVGVVLAASLLLLGAAFATQAHQARQARHTIPD
jgi:hypothetical protein